CWPLHSGDRGGGVGSFASGREWSRRSNQRNSTMLHTLSRLALAAVLSSGLAFAASAGPISDTTTVDATNTVAGIGHVGIQSIKNVGNGGLFYGAGKGAIHKDTPVDATNTVAGGRNFSPPSGHDGGRGGPLSGARRDGW